MNCKVVSCREVHRLYKVLSLWAFKWHMCWYIKPHAKHDEQGACAVNEMHPSWFSALHVTMNIGTAACQVSRSRDHNGPAWNCSPRGSCGGFGEQFRYGRPNMVWTWEAPGLGSWCARSFFASTTLRRRQTISASRVAFQLQAEET